MHTFLIIVLILVTVIFSTKNIENFEQTAETEESTETLKVPISNELAEKSQQPIKTFVLPIPMTIQGPPNSKSVIKKELEYLQKLSENRKIAQISDSIFDYFANYAGSNGLLYDHQHLNQIYQDIDIFAAKLQIFYARPRPYQIATLYGIALAPIADSKGILDASPSYPCRETLIARVLADVLLYNNPNQADKLNSMVKLVELNQLYKCMNYQSDNQDALKVAESLKPHLKYLEVVK